LAGGAFLEPFAWVLVIALHWFPCARKIRTRARI
jgi:hypothetical protein